MPSERPSDIYKLVADKTIVELERLAAEKSHDAEIPQEEDEVSDAELAQWWLDFGISRKITKRNCMTFPYGSKQGAATFRVRQRSGEHHAVRASVRHL